MTGRVFIALLVLSGAYAQTQPPAPDAVLRFDVNLVQVDAIVTDSHGNRVSGLKADDFRVLQDGKPQNITHFSYVAAAPEQAPPAPRSASGQRLVAALPPTKSQVRRTIVFLIDDAGMAFPDFHYAQLALQHYVDENLQPDDLVAVVRTSYGSGASQIFTSDARWLHNIVANMFWRHPGFSFGPAPVLDSLRDAIRILGQYPGRKSIVLISPGLPLIEDWNVVREIADSANRSSVTIETIDCRGLPTLQLTAENRKPDRGFMERQTNYIHSQDLLNFLAQMTAGRFQHDSNDITGQVRNAAGDGDGYYLIGWYPNADTFRIKPHQSLDYHRVKISLREGKGLSVRTRDGFFGVPDMAAKVADTPAEQMNDALFSPFRSGDIEVRLTASLGYDRQDGAYIDSLLYIRPAGIEFHDVPGRSDCKLADLEVLTTPQPLDFDKVPTGRIDGSHAQIEMCNGVQKLEEKGFVVSVRRQIQVPGTYRMLVAVRNMEAGQGPDIGPKTLISRSDVTTEHTPIGTANQLVDVPNLKNEDMTLTGITLQAGQFKAAAMNAQASYRLGSPDDPAVRQFHPGETLNYSFRLLRSEKKSADPTEFRLHLVRDGNEIYVSEPRAAEPDAPVTGAYTLDASTPPGRYLLGISAGKASQWIDFEVK